MESKPRRSHYKKPAKVAVIVSGKSKPLPPPVDVQLSESDKATIAVAQDLGLPILTTEGSPLHRLAESHSPSALENGSTEKLSEDAQRLLDAVPDVIAEEGEGANPIPGGGQIVDEGQPAALAVPGTFNPAMVAEYLTMVHDYVAKWRKFDEYRIGDAKTRLIANPLATMLDALWARYAPLFLTQFSATVPGFLPLIAAGAFVYGPIIKADMARSPQRNAARDAVRPASPASVPGNLGIYAVAPQEE